MKKPSILIEAENRIRMSTVFKLGYFPRLRCKAFKRNNDTLIINEGNNMWDDVCINLFSDLLFAIAVIVITWILFLLTNRKKLRNFFGITENKRMTIYTSNLLVEKYGSVGKDAIPYSFEGTAIPYEESKAAAQLKSLFNYFLPSQLEKPGLLSKLLISDIDVQVVASPQEENNIKQRTSVISIGLPPYNSISRYIEDSFNPSAKLGYIEINNRINIQNHGSSSLENQGITPSGIAAGTAVPNSKGATSASSIRYSHDGERGPDQPAITVRGNSTFSDTSIGFVQRIFDNRNKRSIFYAAGLSENSTAGSVYYLIANWKELFSKYGSDMPFLVLLRIGNNNHLSEIVFEK